LNTVYLGIGSNLGNRLELIRSGLARLARAGLAIRRVSAVFETEPVSPIPQGAYLNCAVRLHTRLAPAEVLARCQAIEAACGRVRQQVGEARPLDLDILLFGRRVVDAPGLVIPHPRLVDRRFVLEPMAEAFPEVRHPVLGKSMRRLLRECTDPHRVVVYCKAPALSL